jgi:DNA-directed RNA polymerase omega subunit
VIQRPPGFGAFEFVVLSTLRAQQLIRGGTPRVDEGGHKKCVIAQSEIAEGKVIQLPFASLVVVDPDAAVPVVPA